MKCPYCHKPLGPSDVICPACGQPLPEYIESDEPQSFWDRRLVRAILFVLGAAIAIFVIGFAIYKLTYWAEDYQVERLYARGERTPTVSEAHAGRRPRRPRHQLLRRGRRPGLYPRAGALHHRGRQRRPRGGGRQRLVRRQDLTTWKAPKSASPRPDRRRRRAHAAAHHRTEHRPAAIAGGGIEPRGGRPDGVYLRIPAGVQVVPGSTVLVNGEDVTDVVDRSGLLSANVNVYPHRRQRHLHTRAHAQPCGDPPRRDHLPRAAGDRSGAGYLRAQRDRFPPDAHLRLVRARRVYRGSIPPMWKRASTSTCRPAISSFSPTLNTSARTPCAPRHHGRARRRRGAL